MKRLYFSAGSIVMTNISYFCRKTRVKKFISKNEKKIGNINRKGQYSGFGMTIKISGFFSNFPKIPAGMTHEFYF